MDPEFNKKETLSQITKQEWESHFKTQQVDFDSIILNHLTFKGLQKEAEEFAREKNIKIEPDVSLKTRTQIREEIKNGNIDLAISKINDVNSGLLDNNMLFYYFLIEQKAAEMICDAHEHDYDEKVENIIKYVRDECSAIIEEHEVLINCLEDLMEYLVFANADIKERRDELAEFITKAVSESLGKNDILTEKVKKIVLGEKNLKEKYVFPYFNSYCK